MTTTRAANDAAAHSLALRWDEVFLFAKGEFERLAEELEAADGNEWAESADGIELIVYVENIYDTLHEYGVPMHHEPEFVNAARDHYYTFVRS